MDHKQQLVEVLHDLSVRREGMAHKVAELDRAIEGVQLAIKLTRAQTPSATSRGGLVGAIRAIVADSLSPVTAKDVRAELQGRFPDMGETKLASVSSALARLAEQDEIRLLQEGAGRRAALYQRKEVDATEPAMTSTAA